MTAIVDFIEPASRSVVAKAYRHLGRLARRPPVRASLERSHRPRRSMPGAAHRNNLVSEGLSWVGTSQTGLERLTIFRGSTPLGCARRADVGTAPRLDYADAATIVF
jgi:hypothetical protein